MLSRKFDFGPGLLAPGYRRVVAQNLYNRETGFGFEPGSQVVCMDCGEGDALASAPQSTESKCTNKRLGCMTQGDGIR